MSHLILLPTDFSEYSRMTADMVSGIPGEHEIILLHVAEGGSVSTRRIIGNHQPSSSSVEQSLEAEKVRLVARGNTVRTIILKADGRDIPGLILSYARKEQVDLIMLGARGKGVVEGLLLGSVSSKIVRNATTDVLITHHPGLALPFQKSPEPKTNQTPLFSRVLYPVDFSKPCLERLSSLMARSFIDEIVLLNIIPNADNRKELDQAISGAYLQLQDLGKRYNESSTKVKLLLRFGKPAEMICTMALEEKATLVALPRLGASDFTRSLPIGSTAEEVVKKAKIPVCLLYPDITLDVSVRELEKDEFPLAEKVWAHYHQQKADSRTDRIFGVFVEGMLVAIARCRRHPDGLEVDGVFTLDDFRGRGYARDVMQPLVSACGNEILYMHSTLGLVEFYRQFGFEKIPEQNLPPTIKARFDFAMGEMQGSNVQPMMRRATGQ